MTERDFDSFFAADFDSITSGWNPAFTVTAGFTIDARANLLTVASFTGGTGALQRGQLVVLTESGKPACYGHIGAAPDATHVYFKPIRSAANGAVVFGATAYTTAAVLSAAPQTAATLVVDLSECPGTAQVRYLILASGAFTTTSTSVKVAVGLRSKCPLGDPLFGPVKNVVTAAPLAVGDWEPFSSAHSVLLTPGERYEFHLQLQCTSGTTDGASLRNAAIAALRCDAITESGDAETGNTSTTTSTTVTTVDAGLNSASDNSVLLVSGTLAAGSGTATVSCANSGTTIGTVTINGTSGKEVSVGMLAYNYSDVATVTLSAAGGATAVFKSWYAAVIPIKSLRIAEAFRLSTASASNGSSSPAWDDTINQTFGNVTAGDYLDIVSFNAKRSTGTADRYEVRPVFDSTIAEAPHRRGGWLASEHRQGFMLGHVKRTTQTRRGWVQTSDFGGSPALNLANTFFSFLRLTSALNVRDTTPVSLVADIETALVPRRWSQVSGQLWRVALTGLERVSRVLVNGVAYVRVADQPANNSEFCFNPEPGTDGEINTTVTTGEYQSNAGGSNLIVADSTYFRVGRRVKVANSAGTLFYHADITASAGVNTWTLVGRAEAGDSANGTQYVASPAATVKAMPGSYLYVKFATGVSPSDPSVFVTAYATLALGRTAEDVTDADRWLVPYAPRIAAIPGPSATLEVTGAAPKVTTSFGELAIANDDGAYDDLFVSRLFEGGYLTLLRGYSSLSRDIRDFERLAKAMIQMASVSPKLLRLRLFDVAFSLPRAVLVVKRMAFEGVAGSMREGAYPAVVFGSVKRVAAIRLTNLHASTSDVNWYQVSGNRLKAISAVYRTVDSQTSYSTTATFLTWGMFSMSNTNSSGTTDPPDVLYADVDGQTIDDTSGGALLESPGEIAQWFLTNYPKAQDGTTALSTAVATSAFVLPSGYTTATLIVASVGSGDATIREGSRLRVTSGALKAFVQVTATSGTTLTVVALREPGDAVPTTSFAVASVVDHLIPGPGTPLATTDLALPTFRMLDRVWRLGRDSQGSTLIPVKVGLVISDQAATVRSSLEALLGSVFAYWRTNRAGRMEIRVPDFGEQNLLVSGGFENSPDAMPWMRQPGTTRTIETTIVYDGPTAAKITAGPCDSESGLRQRVLIPGPGLYLVTAVLQLETPLADESSSYASISAIDPGDGFTESIGDPVNLLTLSTGSWVRAYCLLRATGAGTAAITVHNGKAVPVPTPTLDLAVNLSPTSGLTTRDGDEISALSNLASPGTGDFAQSTSGQRPHWYESRLNRKATMAFDGGDVMARSGGSYSLGTKHAIFAVVRFNNTSGEHTICGEDTGGSRLSYSFTTGKVRYLANATAAVELSATLTSGVWYLIGATRTGTLVNVFCQDVNFVGTLDVNNYFPLQYLGALNSAATTNPLNGDIAELVVLNDYPSDTGASVRDYLRRKWGTLNPTIRIDNVECVPIAGLLTDSNTEVESCEFREPAGYAARATFAVRHADQGRASAYIALDNEGRDIAAVTTSEAQATNPVAGIVDFGAPLLVGLADARGVAAAAAAFHGRLRAVLRCTTHALEEVALPGDLVYVDHHRVPETRDTYRLWRIVTVEADVDRARGAKVELERPVDPISDRTVTS